VSFVVTIIRVHKKLLESKDLKAAGSCKTGRHFYWIRWESGKKLKTWKGILAINQLNAQNLLL